MATTVFLSRSPRLLNWGPGGPVSLGAGLLYRILSPTRLIPNWSDLQLTDFLSSPGLYDDLTPTLLPASVIIALIQPVHGQGYNILIFFDWMHLLFTQVHFLFWQPSRVGSQYATVILILFEQNFFGKMQHSAGVALSIPITLSAIEFFFCFANWKFISRIWRYGGY